MTFEDYFSSLRAKRIAVVGTGVSNLPLIRLLAERGCDVTACDKREADALGAAYGKLTGMGIKLKLGDDYLQGLDFDVIFRTPGLHPMALEDAKRRGAVLTSEMEAFFALCPCRTIAVTGSDGKTTTSTLIAELLKTEGINVFLGGNIGKPLLSEVPNMKSSDIAVLELSSFQLHSMVCRPDVAVVTNIFPNHLDVHPSYEDYIQAKKNIYLHQKNDCVLVLNRDNTVSASFASDAPARVVWFSRKEKVENGCFFDGKTIFRFGRELVDAQNVCLPGLHNIENLMAAFSATAGIVSDASCKEVAERFGGVRHRLELVREKGGVKYYNDSIATSPTRTIAGLRSFDGKPILIAGGHDKKVPFDGLADEINRRCKAVFLTGETAMAIKCALENSRCDAEKPPVYVIEDFGQAVLAAAEFAKKGDVVLLSPACSSFDKFRSFEVRGDTFREIVKGM